MTGPAQAAQTSPCLQGHLLEVGRCWQVLRVGPGRPGSPLRPGLPRGGRTESSRAPDVDRGRFTSPVPGCSRSDPLAQADSLRLSLRAPGGLLGMANPAPDQLGPRASAGRRSGRPETWTLGSGHVDEGELPLPGPPPPVEGQV